jgi:hypothetical protein
VREATVEKATYLGQRLRSLGGEQVDDRTVGRCGRIGHVRRERPGRFGTDEADDALQRCQVSVVAEAGGQGESDELAASTEVEVFVRQPVPAFGVREPSRGS